MTEPLRVWAPRATAVSVETNDERRALERQDDSGWWCGDPPVQDYSFVLDHGAARPDPRSRWQPNGVHGPSRPIKHAAYRWTDAGWSCRDLLGSVIYELHVGTFTDEGTFGAAIKRLGHLVELGIDFVEIMPVNAFPGRRGWGYDGVDLYAVHDPYGGPDELKAFVDACHNHGLGVILDVVYNHLGPDGNYLPEFGPYFTDKHETPWGAAVNLDDEGSAEVRAFFIDNARQWSCDYHFDGLRLDAVHAFVDDSPQHFLAELHDAVAKLRAELGRPLFLIAESDLNDPRVITARDAGGYGMDAQWSDDFHHALHAALTGERNGYYADYGSLADLAKALTEGFVYTGQHSAYRGTQHGAPLPASVSGHQLLGYLQDHDQVGNRARGERSAALMPRELLYVGAALVLTSPFTPMLFMGEEWGASTPWQYFTDHQNEDLARAVRDGRRSEFAAFGWDPADVPDPQDPATFARSCLDWTEPLRSPHRELLDWHRDLIVLRRLWPDLREGVRNRVRVRFDDDARWIVVHRGDIVVACNLADASQSVPIEGDISGAVPRVLLASAQPRHVSHKHVDLAPRSVAIVK
ncbi:MAG: malto-oligosyltrehalose trehalohydrolase [Actinomycetes bacterium]